MAAGDQAGGQAARARGGAPIAATLGPKLDEIVDGFAARLSEFVAEAGAALARGIAEVLAGALAERQRRGAASRRPARAEADDELLSPAASGRGARSSTSGRRSGSDDEAARAARRGGQTQHRRRRRAAERPQPWVRRHLVWAAVVRRLPGRLPVLRAVNNPNENVRVWATRAIAHHGTFAIDQVIREWGEVGDRAAAGGQRYSSKAPGTSLLGVPVHFVHDRLARALTGALAVAAGQHLGAAGVHRDRRRWPCSCCSSPGGWRRETGSPWARDLLMLGLGLGTMFYPYGLDLRGPRPERGPAVRGLPGADARCCRRQRRDPETGRAPARGPRARLALAGLLAGLSVVFEYQTLFAAAVVAGCTPSGACAGGAGAAGSSLGALGPALLLAVYHTALFGRPWALPYAHLDDEGYRLYHHSQGFLGLGRPRAAGAARRPSSASTTGCSCSRPSWRWAAGRAGGGAAQRAAPAPRAQAVILAVTVVMAVFLAGMANWRGGWCAGGPRYIAAVVPFLAFAWRCRWRTLFADRAALAPGRAWPRWCWSRWSCAGCRGRSSRTFPSQFDNPIFDLVLPLLARRVRPAQPGHGAGPVGAGLACCPWLLAAGRRGGGDAVGARPRWTGRRRAVALAARAAGRAVAAWATGRRLREEERARDTVRGMWEPPPRSQGAR